MTISPTARRRRLGIELRRLRELSGLTGVQVARELACSEAKISRIEAGKHAVRVADVVALLDVYKVADQSVRESLAAIARESGRRGWWVQYSDAIPDWFEVHLGLESAAVEIRLVETAVVPGLLQTPDYAAALIRAGQPLIPAEEVDRQVGLRMARQARIYNDQVKLQVVIGEGALSTTVGPPSVMAEQMDALVKAARRPNVELRIIRFRSPGYAAFAQPFVILDFAEDDDTGLVYIEHWRGGLHIDEAAAVSSYRLLFTYLVAGAESLANSVKIVRQRADSRRLETGDK